MSRTFRMYTQSRKTPVIALGYEAYRMFVVSTHLTHQRPENDNDAPDPMLTVQEVIVPAAVALMIFTLWSI